MVSRVVLANLPCKIGGYCVVNADGDKICVLNSRHSFETNKKTLLHEQEHIVNNDFEGHYKVDEIELFRRR